MLNTGTAGNKIFASYLVDVKTQVKQFDLKGKLEREIELSWHWDRQWFWRERIGQRSLLLIYIVHLPSYNF